MSERATQLPQTFRPLLWSYDFDELDPDRHKKTIISAVIRYGRLREWRWIIDHYGREEIKSVLAETPASSLRPSLKKLLELVFDITPSNHAPRGAHR